MKKIMVLGLGVSGIDVTVLALQKGYSVVCVDSNFSEQLAESAKILENEGAEVFLDCQSLNLDSDFESIIISPGIPPDMPLALQAADSAIPVISEIEFAARFCSAKIIAITGTNGKTTTVEMMTHCLNALGKNAVAAGNIGYTLSRVIFECIDSDFVVLEMSSFQLEKVDAFSVEAAAILNLSSDHIDRYASESEYFETKLKLINHCHLTTNVIINSEICDLLEYKEAFKNVKEKPKTFSLKRKADFYFDSIQKEFADCANVETKKVFIANKENILAVKGLLHICGFRNIDLSKLLNGFLLSPHRLEKIFETKNKICVINDSKSTNPHSINHALNTLGDTNLKNILLIAGGMNKKMNFRVVNSALASYVRKVYLMGESKHELEDAWSSLVTCELCDSLEDAIDLVIHNVKDGEMILFSPGCSSFDMFKNYADRGEQFISIMKRRFKK